MSQDGEDATRKVRERRLQRLRFWRRACAVSSPDVQVHGDTGDVSPLVFFHGDFEAGGTHVKRLAELMGRPVVAIAPAGLHGGEVPPDIPAMAAERLPVLLQACPEGPYRLGGYCNGAALAYETARLLEASGRRVAYVVLVEPLSLSVRPGYRAFHAGLAAAARLATRNPARRASLVGRPMGALVLATRVAGAGFRRSLSWSLSAMRLRSVRLLRRWRNESAAGGLTERTVQDMQAGLTRLYAAALYSWLPPRSAFPVVALSSGFDVGGSRCASYDAAAWNRVCADFRHVRLPGDHHSCMWDTVETLAGHLQSLHDGGPAGMPRGIPESAPAQKPAALAAPRPGPAPLLPT